MSTSTCVRGQSTTKCECDECELRRSLPRLKQPAWRRLQAEAPEQSLELATIAEAFAPATPEEKRQRRRDAISAHKRDKASRERNLERFRSSLSGAFSPVRKRKNAA